MKWNGIRTTGSHQCPLLGWKKLVCIPFRGTPFDQSGGGLGRSHRVGWTGWGTGGATQLEGSCSSKRWRWRGLDFPPVRKGSGMRHSVRVGCGEEVAGGSVSRTTSPSTHPGFPHELGLRGRLPTANPDPKGERLFAKSHSDGECVVLMWRLQRRGGVHRVSFPVPTGRAGSRRARRDARVENVWQLRASRRECRAWPCRAGSRCRSGSLF